MKEALWKSQFPELYLKVCQIFSFDDTDEASLIFLACQKKLIPSQIYLKWAQKFYGIAILTDDFFTQKFDLSIFEKFQYIHTWTPDCIPVFTWDDILFVACLDPQKLEKIPNDINVKPLLTSFENLQWCWQQIKSLSNSVVQPTEFTHDDLPIPLNNNNNRNAKSTEQSVFDNTGLLVLADVPEDKFDHNTNSNINTLDVMFEDDEVEHSMVQETPIEQNTSTPDGLIEDEPILMPQTNIKVDTIKKQSPQVNPPPPQLPPMNLPPNKLPSALLTNPKIPISPKPVAVAPAPANGLKTINLDSSFNTISFVLHDIHDDPKKVPLKKTEAITPPPPIDDFQMSPPAQKKSSMNQSDFTSLTAVNSNIDVVTQELFSQAYKYYNKVMILTLHNDETLTPFKWDGGFKINGQTTPLSLKKPSPFRIAFRTKKPYHGPIFINKFLENFLIQWFDGNKPYLVTIVPLMEQNFVYGFLLFSTDTEIEKKPALDYCLKLASQFSEDVKHQGLLKSTA